MAGPALREVLARFGVEVDAKKLEAFDLRVRTTVGSLKDMGKAVQAVGVVAAGGLLYAGISRLVGGLSNAVHAASDSEEAMNVLRETFKENADGVVSWADTTGKAMGRASSTLRGYAGDLGALLVPMIGNREAAAEMSKTLSALAIDLGSFFNRADDDVLVALRAGIVGESEPMRRLGSDLTEASLNAFALANGMKAITKSTTPAEKIQLRFAKIMSDTADKQGDAARTANGFANASKALSENWKALSETAGSVLLPAVTLVVRGLRSMVSGANSFLEAARQSRVFEVAAVILGRALGARVLPMLLRGFRALIPAIRALWPVLAPIVIPIAKFIALTLVVDELITAFEGGSTVIGDFVDSIFGIGSTQAFLDGFRAVWDDIYNGVRLTIAAVQDLWASVENVQKKALAKIGTKVTLSKTDNVDQVMNSMKNGSNLGAAWSGQRTLSESGRMRRDDKANEALTAGDLAGFVNQRRKGESREDATARFLMERKNLVQTGKVEMNSKDRSLFSAKELKAWERSAAGKAQTAKEVAAAATTVTQNTTLQINVPLGTSKEMVKAIESAVKNINERNARAVKVALGNGAG
jgi:hypothetical protein